jgi:hypothetical protein
MSWSEILSRPKDCKTDKFENITTRPKLSIYKGTVDKLRKQKTSIQKRQKRQKRREIQLEERAKDQKTKNETNEQTNRTWNSKKSNKSNGQREEKFAKIEGYRRKKK